MQSWALAPFLCSVWAESQLLQGWARVPIKHPDWAGVKGKPSTRIGKGTTMRGASPGLCKERRERDWGDRENKLSELLDAASGFLPFPMPVDCTAYEVSRKCSKLQRQAPPPWKWRLDHCLSGWSVACQTQEWCTQGVPEYHISHFPGGGESLSPPCKGVNKG